jgi:hypothetical protein
MVGALESVGGNVEERRFSAALSIPNDAALALVAAL